MGYPFYFIDNFRYYIFLKKYVSVEIFCPLVPPLTFCEQESEATRIRWISINYRDRKPAS